MVISDHIKHHMQVTSDWLSESSQQTVPIAAVAMATSCYEGRDICSEVVHFKIRLRARLYLVLCLDDNRTGGCYGVIISSREHFDTPQHISVCLSHLLCACNIMLLGDQPSLLCFGQLPFTLPHHQGVNMFIQTCPPLQPHVSSPLSAMREWRQSMSQRGSNSARPQYVQVYNIQTV